MRNSKAIKKLPITLLLLCILYVPTVSPYLFYSITVTLLAVLAITRHIRIELGRRECRIVLVFFALATIAALLRSIIFQASTLRDLIELGRLVPIVIFFASIRSLRRHDPQSFANIFIIFVFINVAVAYFQRQGGNGFTVIIENIYAVDIQAFYSWYRATGLANGPGDLAVTHLFFYLYFFNRAIYGLNTLFNLFMAILCAYVIWATQSQTVFVTFVAISILLITYIVIKGSAFQKGRTLIVVAIGGSLLASTSFIYTFIIGSNYLGTLFTQGLARSAYTKRIDKWNRLLDMSKDHYSGYILGWGKDLFGTLSQAMDNEYLYVYLVYGPFLFICFYFMLAKLFFILIRHKQLHLNPTLMLLTSCIVASVVLSWPSGFYTYPKTGLLFVLFFLMSHKTLLQKTK